jgi:hypothetical protein
MSSELEDAIARLNALRAAYSNAVLEIAGGVQQYRYPDGSGITYSPAGERLASLEPIKREMAAVQARIDALTGAARPTRIRQVRIIAGKGLS